MTTSIVGLVKQLPTATPVLIQAPRVKNWLPPTRSLHARTNLMKMTKIQRWLGPEGTATPGLDIRPERQGLVAAAPVVDELSALVAAGGETLGRDRESHISFCALMNSR